MYLDQRSKGIRLHWSMAICSQTISSWNNIPAMLHSHRTSVLKSHLQHFHQPGSQGGHGEGTHCVVGTPSMATSPLGRCFAVWKEGPTDRVIKPEKGYFLLLASDFSLTAFFLKKKPDGILIIFKASLKYQCLHPALCAGSGGCGAFPVTVCCHRPVWWQHNYEPQHCSGDRQMWKGLTKTNAMERDWKGTSICFHL